VAWQDDTVVTFTPSITTQAGAGIPAVAARTTYEFAAILTGDVLKIESGTPDAGFCGTKLSANKPIAVFSTHTLANVPTGVCCGDHLEEQLTGQQMQQLLVTGITLSRKRILAPKSGVHGINARPRSGSIANRKTAEIIHLESGINS
jgi:hypothetical protein